MEKIIDHYRNTSKSDHLAKEDIIGLEQPIVYTISHCVQDKNRKVAGKNIPLCNVAFFKEEGVKPWVINQTNAKILAGFCGTPSVSQWKNVPVELYVDMSVKMKGVVVGGIKLRKQQPQIAKEEMNENNSNWNQAIDRVANGMSKAEMEKFYSISDENYSLLLKLGGNSGI